MQNECPITGNCVAKRVIYKAEFTTTDDQTTKYYIGMTSNEFKIRYNNHLKYFRDKAYRNETELSKHVWGLKETTRDLRLKWCIVKHAVLCLEEKLLIMKADKRNLLNKRAEETPKPIRSR